MTSPHTDVVVLGAGVIGLSAALSLLERGRSVRVLEAATVGAGSSHGNCGTLTPSHAPPLAAPGVIRKALGWMLAPDAPLYIRPRWDPALWSWLLKAAARSNPRDWQASARAKAALLNHSRGLFAPRLAEWGIACEFEQNGLLYAFRSERGLQEVLDSLPDLRELGIEVAHWDRAAIREREPSLREGTVGGVYFPGDASLRPDRYVAGLADAVRRRGGHIDEQWRVRGVRSDAGQWEAQADDGRRVRGRQLLIALGAWSPLLARNLAVPMPIQPGKGYSITFERAPAVAPRHALVLKERSVCVTRWGSGFRLGSTMEFSGYDSRLTPARLDALCRAAAEYLESPVDAPRVEEWYGWRPMTWDDLPIIGALPGHAGAFAATGHGMLGVSMSLGTAELVAALMCGQAAAVDPAPYSPARFA